MEGRRTSATAPGLHSVVIEELAGRLVRAERQQRPMPALSSMMPDLSVADAYAIQDATARHRIESGEWIVGWKIGLTSLAAQQQFETDEPDYAPLLSDQLATSAREGAADGSGSGDGSGPSATVAIDELIQPRVEAEIAFEVGRDLAGPGVTARDVIVASAGLRAAIQIVDSRIEDWRIRLPDTIADLASSARVAVGGRLGRADTSDLRRIGVAFERNGKGIATGQGSAVLGHPAEAVAWLANELGRRGVALEAGQIVLSGPLHVSVPATRGDTFRAIFDRLGSVSVTFV